MEARYLILEVYRGAHGHDCTLGGISGKVPDVFVVHPEGPWDMDSVRNSAERHGYRGDPTDLIFTAEQRGPDYWALKPVNARGPVAFGGNLAYSSDSRAPHAYRIHDRDMSKEAR